MSDAETVANGLSDSDTLSDNKRVSVGRKAPRSNLTHTASIGRAVNRAFYEKPEGTGQRKFLTPRVTICPPTSQAHHTATDTSKTPAGSLETQIEWNFLFEGLKYRLDNVEEARKKDQKKMEVMMEMIMQLQDESSRKRKVGDEDVGSVEESSKMRMKKRTCVETVEEY